jgi:hypothetical protein
MIRSFRYSFTFVVIGSLILPPLVALSTVVSGIAALPPGASHKMELYGVVAAGVCVAFYLLFVRIEPHLLRESQNQAAFLDTISGPFLSIAIAGSAALSLLLELAIIRWQGTIFEFFAFYKNYGLLACFAGLGLGYALCRSDDGIPLHLTLPLLAWQLGFLTLLRYALPGHYGLDMVPFREQLNMGLGSAKPIQIAVIYLLLSVVFVSTALVFIPVGQLCGKLMERQTQLSAYGLNLLGSVFGVCLMFLVSSLWTPPIVWFGLCCLALFVFLERTPKLLLLGAAFTMLVTVILAWPVKPLWNRLYSPYQLLEIGYSDTGLMIIRAAGHYYQRVHNLSDAAVQATTDPTLRQTRNYYELPYRIHPGQNLVAVVGAGTGNDVAAALRSGARQVDAIEIDPAILVAGKVNHPEKPYDDTRVRAAVNDARSFFRNTSNHYDLIVYGLLDSHTLLSHASSVRLDSFVYTIEGLREARSRLTDNGVLSLSFSVINDDLGTKIFQMMREAFDGKEPVCISALYDHSVIFLQSKYGDLSIPPVVLSEAGFEERTGFYRNSRIKVDVSTDDWPFLYMPRRIYPVSYLPVLGLVLLLSIILNGSLLQGRPRASHLPFFFLGAGFMLVETKAITELGLVFGNTWQVIAIAIASILIMAFLANGLVQLLRESRPYVPYVLLFASLAAGWWIARSGGLPSTTVGRIGTAIILTCPLFFSGIVFSVLLSRQTHISSVMSMNLMGAMCGGILEYNSMYFGFHFLYLLALCLYAAALLSGLTFRTEGGALALAEEH